MKKSFVLYLDQYSSIKKLSDEQAGMLLKAMFEFNLGNPLEIIDPVVDMAFSFLGETFKRDSDKYLKICEKNKENARKRWDKDNATASERSLKNAKHADSDSDSDKIVIEDSESDSGSEKQVHPFQAHMENAIKKENLFAYEKKITEFYKYRMAMKKKDQYQTEKGINGLIRNVLELQGASLDVNDSLEYAMEKNWKAPELKYFKLDGKKGMKTNGFGKDGYYKPASTGTKNDYF